MAEVVADDPKGVVRAPSTLEQSSILLVIERPLPNHFVRASKIVIEGFALARAEIDEITVEIGEVVQTAVYGIHRDDLARRHPSHPALARSGFSCEIDRNLVAAAATTAGREVITFTVTVRDRYGEQRKVESSFVLSSPDGARAGFQADERLPDTAMILQVDEKFVDRRGLLRVSGWAVALSPIETVSVYLGMELIGSAELGLARDDVALTWTQFPNADKSGFLFVTDATAFLPDEPQNRSPRHISIVARAAGGVARQQSFPLELPRDVQRRKPQEFNEFYCDDAGLTSAGSLSMTGWAASSVGIEKIRVMFENDLVGLAEHGLERPDVGNRFPTIAGSRKSGFSFSANIDPAKLKVGHEYTVRIETVLADGRSRTNTVVVTARDRVAQPLAALVGVDEIILTIDEPLIVDGKLERKVENSLSMAGWALAKAGVAAINFALDGVNVGSAYYGIRREDVAKAFPSYGWDNALLSGFAFSLPKRFLSEGKHEVRLEVKTKSNAQKIATFEIDVGAIGEQVGPWTLRQRLPATEILLQTRLIDSLEHRPTFYICVNCDSKNLKHLPETMRSISAQSYDSWTVMVVAEGKLARSIERQVSEQFPEISRRVICGPGTESIKRLAADAKSRDLMLPLDAGDALAADALFEFAVALNQADDVDFIYADEIKYNMVTNREEAYFKPDWSPTLLFSANYIGRPWCATFERLRKSRLNVLRSPVANFDALLRLTEQAANIVHVQRILARRGADNIEAPAVEMRALKGALKRRAEGGSVKPGLVKNTYRCRPAAKIEDLVSVIIPTCASRGLVKVCIESLRNVSTYKNIEIICIENISDAASEWKQWLRDNCDVVIEINENFNWSLFNNIAAEEASGSYLLFLNDDIEIIHEDWLDAMLDQARRKDVGVVGPQLLYPDRKVQHAGMFLTDRGIARHSFRFCAEDDPGYFGLALTQRDVVGVTGACMLVKTETFRHLGGFDENHAVINNDLDFCLRLQEQNLRSVYTPFARLIHHELASRKDLKDEHDVEAFRSRWSGLIGRGDPYFHPALDKNKDTYQVEHEAAELVFAGHPFFRKRSIKNILAVKVDHIGDFITAFPALRRIKAHFPEAKLSVLAAPASKHLAKLEPAIDEVIVFEFFHARSQLGRTELSEARLLELRRQLATFEFDIALDLRKHPDTRTLLQYTNAKLTAGFNYRNEYPWLDVALTWDGDVQLVRKHQHTSDDLVNLVDAVAAAGNEQAVFPRSGDWSSREAEITSRLSELNLYRRPLVCLHPASGTEMRQWPPRRFIELANALLATEDVDIALMGGPDEVAVADLVEAHIRPANRVHNLIGKFALHELPYFLSTCALFVGNNSGPKHIAAGLGVPTVGIHSGVVDAAEWGPLGPAAVAVQRNMSCSPCYLAKRDDCARRLACLEGLEAAQILSMCRKLLRFEWGLRI